MRAVSLFLLAVVSLVAASGAGQYEVDLSDNDESIRLAPELETDAVPSSDTKGMSSNWGKHSYINYDGNHIDMNGDDWSSLGDKLQQARTEADFVIVHIGDSHIQADGNSGTTRRLFQENFGDAGRGIIIPFRLAGTNQPLDYSIATEAPFVKATLMRQPWPVQPGFTGVAIHPEVQKFSFSLGFKSECGYFTVIADGNPEVTGITSNGIPVGFTTEPVPGGVEIMLDRDCTDLVVSMQGDDVNVYGFDLRGDSGGVVYHAIGNNGAQYASYNSIPDFGARINLLNPDLVIVSLGTNEAFGRFDSEAFKAQIESMVRKISSASPSAKILLTTPSECQKSTYTRRNGRRRRTRNYQVNRNVKLARDLIADYGRANKIPVYDFYAVAGGDGSSAKWLADRLLSKDRIHRTWEGYRVDGELMYDALLKALNLPLTH